MKLVYIAGPLTKGGDLRNVKAALDAGNEVRKIGMVPIVPHLSIFADMLHPMTYESWMYECKVILERCDYLLRIPGESPGADREVKWAFDAGIIVCANIKSLVFAEGLDTPAA